MTGLQSADQSGGDGERMILKKKSAKQVEASSSHWHNEWIVEDGSGECKNGEWGGGSGRIN